MDLDITVTRMTSISMVFRRCMSRYGELLDLVANEDCAVMDAEEDMAKAKDGYGRLLLWGDQEMAVLPESARHSLDEQLRNDDETRDVVLSSLGRLSRHLETAYIMAYTFKDCGPLENEQYEPSSSDESSDSNNTDLSPNIHVSQTKSSIHKILENVYREIRSLYRISALLSHPRLTTTNAYLDSKMRTSSDVETSTHYIQISNMICQWRDSANHRKGKNKEDWPTGKIQEMKVNHYANLGGHSRSQLLDIKFLLERLTLTNVRRCGQIEDWTGVPDTLGKEWSSILTPEDPCPTSNSPGCSLITEREDALFDDAETFGWPITGLRDTKAENQTHHAHNMQADNLQDILTVIPHVPKSSYESNTFECPLCRIHLSSTDMYDRMNWTLHLIGDLKPYVCTFEACKTPERTFAARGDWTYHEQQMHRRQWICPEGCAEKLQSKAAMVGHLQRIHRENLNEHQISILADMCERETDLAESSQCLICLDTMSLKELQSHLAKHMETIALSVLSVGRDEEGDESIPVDVQAESEEENVNQDSMTFRDTTLTELQNETESSSYEDSEEGSADSMTLEQHALATVFRKSFGKIQQNSKKTAAWLEKADKEILAGEKDDAEAEIALGEDPTGQVPEDSIAKTTIDISEHRKMASEAWFRDDLAHTKELAETLSQADATTAGSKTAVKNLAQKDHAGDAIRFTDAVGRNFSIPWHLSKSWKGMEAFITQAFANIEALSSRVANGHYNMIGPHDRLILPRIWDVVAQPGWHIKMELWPLPEFTGEDASSGSTLALQSFQGTIHHANVYPKLSASIPLVIPGHDDHENPVVGDASNLISKLAVADQPIPYLTREKKKSTAAPAVLASQPCSSRANFSTTSIVTGVSRPLTHEEAWLLYDFETHCRACKHCKSPYRQWRTGASLCHRGKRMAKLVAETVYMQNGEVYERYSRHRKRMRVEIPQTYTFLREQLQVMEEMARLRHSRGEESSDVYVNDDDHRRKDKHPRSDSKTAALDISTEEGYRPAKGPTKKFEINS